MTASDSGSSLLSGEKVVMESDGGLLSLTNYRVRLVAAARGHSRYLTITLDPIVSCGVVTRTRPFLLLLAVVAGVGGVVAHDDGVRVALFAFGLGLVVAYLATRSAMLTISSAGESIAVPAKGLGHDSIVEFIDAVDAAKLAFNGVEQLIDGESTGKAGAAAGAAARA